MARSQTFSVSLSLLTKNFEKGIKGIQASLGRLKGQFRTFMGGIGLGVGIEGLIDNAKQLDKVQTTLKNVSGSYAQFGENQKFVMDLAKEYNQDLITLMGNYAKFYSAASYAGMSLKEQQYIYESLTRASAYFNLTADETNGVMLAVQQMISKGKVSSEELRRQLGERLPGAMNLAAKAMGVTTAELDKMIRDGKVMAKDLLPLLASELNILTSSLNVDTIQGATNKLKTSFTDLVQKLNVGDIYKKVLNGLAATLQYVSDNFKKVKQNFNALLIALGSTTLFRKASDAWKGYFAAIAIESDKTRNLANRHLAVLENQKAKGNITFEFDDKGLITKLNRISTISDNVFDSMKLHANGYNKAMGSLANTQPIVTGWQKIGHVFKAVGASIVNMVKAYAPMLIILAVTKIIQGLKNWYKEQQRIKNIVRDTNAEYEKLANELDGREIALENLKFTEDMGEEDKVMALRTINSLLGLEGKNMLTLESTNTAVNEKIEERLKLLKEEREYQAALQVAAEKRKRLDELKKENEVHQANYDNYSQQKDSITGFSQGENASRESLSQLMAKEQKAMNKNNLEIENLTKALEGLEKKVKEGAIDSVKRQSIINNEGYGAGGDKTHQEQLEEDYKKIQKEYNNSLRALTDKKNDELITEEEYNDALEDLYKSTLDNIYALNDINENSRPFAKELKENYLTLLKSKETENEVQKALEKYNKAVGEAKNQFNDGLITQKDLDDELYRLLEEVVMTLSAMGELGSVAEDLAKALKKEKAKRDKANRDGVIENIGKEQAPKLGKYDSTLNYKKENSEIYADNAEYLDEYAKELDDYIERLKKYKDELSGADLAQLNLNITQLEAGMGILTRRAEDFAQAAKFAEVQEDIKKMKAELAEGIFDNISGIATAAERLTNSWKSLTETMEDPEVDGWTKFLTIFTTIMSTIETIVGVVKAFNAVMAIAEGLSLATAAAEQLGIPTKVQDAIATKAQAAAEKELATARHMAQAAALPYPANIAAIASTSAALAAAFAAIPQFSNGGYVGGNSSHGDKVLARLNSGELVLNKGQQSTLWDLLNGGGAFGGKSGNVSFEIKGDRLVGVLNNYNKKISK